MKHKAQTAQREQTAQRGQMEHREQTEQRTSGVPSTKTLVLASHNVSKLQECQALIAQMTLETRRAAHGAFLRSNTSHERRISSDDEVSAEAPLHGDCLPGYVWAPDHWRTRLPEVEEDGKSFYENATKKACVAAKHLGCAALADDSGLEVHALGGAPGVFSKRYAGDQASDADNVAMLLQALRETTDRRAAFVAVLVVADASGTPLLHAEGRCEGHIAEAPAGQAGFGYDPVFVPDGYTKSFAELGTDIKHRLSHRAIAMRSLYEAMRKSPTS